MDFKRFDELYDMARPYQPLVATNQPMVVIAPHGGGLLSSGYVAEDGQSECLLVEIGYVANMPRIPDTIPEFPNFALGEKIGVTNNFSRPMVTAVNGVVFVVCKLYLRPHLVDGYNAAIDLPYNSTVRGYEIAERAA